MTPDDFKLIHYTLYTLITAGVTIGVGRSLHRAGDAFLDECFHGDRAMSASVNHLLLVGFYLVNFGALALFLKTETPPSDAAELIEALARKVGLALLSLGMMHFFNLYNFDSLRRRAINRRAYDEMTATKIARDEPPPPLPGATPPA